MAESATIGQPSPADGSVALDRLWLREEVLQICYWHQGEGFGASFTPGVVLPFLGCELQAVADAFESLAASGEFTRDGDRYVLTAAGKRRGGSMFAEAFVEFQQPSHGECVDGCCEGEEPCPNNGAARHISPSALAAECGYIHVPGEPCNHAAFFRMRYQKS